MLIRDAIGALYPDVIGLQEVLAFGNESQALEIAAELGYEVAFGSAHELGGGVHFGNAVLSRWPIEASHTVRLPDAGTEEERSVLCSLVRSPHGLLPFFVTHLNWKFHEGFAREAQVLELARVLRSHHHASHLPAVLVGDFNAAPEAAEIRFLKGLQSLQGQSFYLDDAFERAGEGTGATFDPDRNPFAAQTHEHPRRIDYVFVRGPTPTGKGKVLKARVVLTDVVESVVASDHYGVYAELRV